jgi:hypothetical protein
LEPSLSVCEQELAAGAFPVIGRVRCELTTEPRAAINCADQDVELVDCQLYGLRVTPILFAHGVIIGLSRLSLQELGSLSR